MKNRNAETHWYYNNDTDIRDIREKFLTTGDIDVSNDRDVVTVNEILILISCILIAVTAGREVMVDNP